MKPSVDFQVLRRKSQQIGKRRGGARLPHSFIHVVAVVEELAARSIGQLRQNVLLRDLRCHAIGGFETGGTDGVVRCIGDVPHIRSVEAARINCVDHNVGASRAVDHFGSLRLKG